MKKLAENAKIPCAVCRDLMPLVQDGIASPESEQLVRAHIAVCPACQALCGQESVICASHSLCASSNACCTVIEPAAASASFWPMMSLIRL